MPDILQPALPNARVLSYITSANTPTRLRELTSRILYTTALIQLGIALVTFTILAWLVISLAIAIGAPWGYGRLVEQLIAEGEGDGWIFLLVPIGYTFSAAIALFVAAKPVRHGRRAACTVARIALFPLLLILPVVAAVSTILAIGLGFPVVQDDIRPAYFLLFLLTPALGLLLLLVIDLFGYLNWIAKNPITEKPPVPFIKPILQKTSA